FNLWDEWRTIYRKDEQGAQDRAREFYEANREAMDEGTSILWPRYFSYYELILIREESGVKSFNQEYQNNPTDEDRQIFKPEYFDEFYFDDEDLASIDTANFGAVDIAMGKVKGDYSVIVSGALADETRKLDVCYA